ncbi:MAG TPA: TIGR02678 family protein [Clostridiales bacterium]|nr:TIGR02678 family protein [Clostridiales bacterium]
MNEMEILLENRWVVRAKDTDLYYKVKNKVDDYKDFIKEKLGYSLIINPRFIKLEKKPGAAECFMGIGDFDSIMEYVFFTIMIMFLEDKGAEEQFILSQLTDYVQSKYEGSEKIDWTIYTHRRRLIKTLRYCSEQYLIRVTDGDDTEFINSDAGEVLYENTGLSKYFVNRFSENILGYNSWEDFEKGSHEDMNIDKGIFLRNRVYRKVFMSPVVYNKGTDDIDYLYIKQHKSVLENDIQKFLDSDFHVHKNGAMILLNENKRYKEVFSSEKNISDIVLQINYEIRERIKNKQFTPKENDVITVSTLQFETLIEDVRNKNNTGWGKSYREMRIGQIIDEVKVYMYYFSFINIKEDEKEIEILPLSYKIVGRYSEGFDGKINEEVRKNDG